FQRRTWIWHAQTKFSFRSLDRKIWRMARVAGHLEKVMCRATSNQPLVLFELFFAPLRLCENIYFEMGCSRKGAKAQSFLNAHLLQHRTLTVTKANSRIDQD